MSQFVGLELIDKHPQYKLYSANCQKKFDFVLEAICEKGEEERLKKFSGRRRSKVGNGVCA
jgi:hypothetical protein